MRNARGCFPWTSKCERTRQLEQQQQQDEQRKSSILQEATNTRILIQECSTGGGQADKVMASHSESHQLRSSHCHSTALVAATSFLKNDVHFCFIYNGFKTKDKKEWSCCCVVINEAFTYVHMNSVEVIDFVNGRTTFGYRKCLH